ncbi:LamG-like jellyroll fold domain-containing protein [Acidipropionibacterium virtanenii]|nr:LamG-like jellyroll fold domain-containing protein [Acidipropionibacterium virtanenii]
MIATSFGAVAPAANADEASTPGSTRSATATPTASTTPTVSTTPTTASPSAVSAHAGLQADYYLLNSDFTFGTHKATVVEQNLNVANMVPNYQRYAGVKEKAGVRWTGSLQAPTTGAYTFTATGDNGFRMWIDGVQVFDWWVDQWDKPQTSKSIQLSSGAHEFKFEQFQNDGGANIKLEWAGPGIARQVVPGSAFRLPSSYDGEWADIAVAESGRTLSAEFDSALSGSVDPSQLTVLADGTALPVSSAGISGKRLTVSVQAPIQKGVQVRLAYNGKGTLTSGGTAVKAFDLPATNGSTYRMSTPWASKVDKNNPLPEYPRPQLVRTQWRNLNGQWGLATLAKGAAAPVNGSGAAYKEKVTVPYALESTLSGIGRHEDHFAYRRTFTVPASWRIGTHQRLKLNFGAVDYDATVYVNGTQVAHHTGGYEAFTADATDALRRGTNELVVKVTDTTGDQPRGKQTPNPSGIFYTSASGIWQTVWMEPTPTASITNVSYRTDLAKSQLQVLTTGDRLAGQKVTVTVRDGHRVVGRATAKGGDWANVTIRRPHLWSPDDPHLYNVTVASGADVVSSYAGMRTVSIGKVDGVNKILLNGRPTFLLSTLDQGYWPDGVYTAPTDEALKWDIRQTKEFGFNTIRKHIKVEPARWYYEADRQGMLVWQDMPANNGGNATSATRDQFKKELSEIVAQHSWSTSIIGYVPMNEGWGEWSKEGTAELAATVKKLDPSRLVNAHSGVNCCNSHGDSGAGDVIDWHQYTGPAFPSPDATRAAINGEHGGFSLSVPGHVWPGGSVNPYGEVADSAALTAAYVKNTAALVRAAGNNLSGSVYTQTTDVEGEVNGLWTYDRQVQKMDKAKVRAANQQVIRAGSGAPGSHKPVGGKEGVARWSMDEGSGTVAKDSTKFGNTLYLGDGVTWGTGADGSGHSLVLAGKQSAQTTVKQLDTTASYTVSSWVKLTSLPSKGGYATFLSADGADQKSSFFLQYGNQADINGFAMSFAGGPRAVAPVTAETGRWYHLVGVRDAATQQLKLYLDGKLVSTVAAHGASPSTGVVALGRGQWEGSSVDYLTGALDGARIWDRALTDAEVAALAK